jgi:hypothetical protein
MVLRVIAIAALAVIFYLLLANTVPVMRGGLGV